MAASPTAFTPSGFFAFRTPLLPREVLAELGAGLLARNACTTNGDLGAALDADHALLVERLRRHVADPIVREALFVASPGLDDAIDVWVRDPAASRAQDVPQSLIRYLCRMAGRPTPFGLFAGCSVGTIGAQTRLVVGPRAEYRRHTRLDTLYLAALCEDLHRDPAVRDALVYRPSAGLYPVAGQLRYAEVRTDPTTHARTCHLVALDRTPYLDALIARAQAGARLPELVDGMLADDPSVERAEAEEFVRHVVESQVLVSELAPPVTGEEALGAVAKTLRGSAPRTAALQVLEGAEHALTSLDASPLGQSSAQYRGIATSLRVLPTEANLARLFQVDLYKPAPHATIGGEPLREIERAVEILARITPGGQNDALERFRKAFLERYGELNDGPLQHRPMVPLMLALDEESGIGFVPNTEPSPLIDGLGFGGAPVTPSADMGARGECLIRGLAETLRAGATEWVLDERDLAALDVGEKPPMPHTFSVMASLAARSEEALQTGDFTLVEPRWMGPAGAVLLGRFCHGDPDLRRAVEAHLRAEEALRPDAVFAEIVHLPDGRVGNILSRPVLRTHEIALLGRGGAQRQHLIPLGDLFLTTIGGRLALWSKRLGKEVVPRLTSAHNFHTSTMGAYRFLGTLQAEGVHFGGGWNWGPAAAAPYLPRVTHGRIVLAGAQWNLGKEELAGLGGKTRLERFRAVQDLRAARGLPRWIALKEADNVLPVDLDNVVSVESFVKLVKTRGSVNVREQLLEDELAASGPEGRFVHELIVPFVRTPLVSTAPATQAVEAGRGNAPEGLSEVPGGSPARAPAVRSFSPGSEWLYARLYAGTGGVDHLLQTVVSPLVRAARASAAADRWYFIRYSDPHWHLRLRFHGNAKRLASELLPRLHELVAPSLANGRIWRVELGTYEREVERYGGDEAIELSEALFEADSDAVAGIVELLDADEASDARWRLAVRGCHLLLVDLGFDLAARTEVVRRGRSMLGTEFQLTKPFEAELGKRFRAERPALEALLATTVGTDHPLDPGFALLEARSRQSAPVVAELRAREKAGRLGTPILDVAWSYLHMHCNRLLHAAQRQQELVVYDWLLRLYESEAARARKAARPAGK